MAHRNPQTENFNSGSELLSQTKNEIAADQLKLGIFYFNAHFIEDNCSTSFKYIKLSAEQGNMEAQFRLAELYSLGHGTSKSYTDAYKWYTKAAIQGYKKALIRIHNLYQNDVEVHSRGKLNSGEELREKVKGYQGIKAEYYYRELNEQRLDDNKLFLHHVIDYYTSQCRKYMSSNQEDPEVQQILGFLYQHGYGVRKYDRWAIEHYTRAAEQGYVDSQYQLGHLYQKNTDIKLNYRKAFYWYKLSSDGGNSAAQNSLAYFYEKGLGTDIDYKNALHWYTKSAESGNSGAQLTLGKWYRKGEYVNQNYTIATKWYTLAAQQGSGVAKNCLAQLFQTGRLSSLPSMVDISEYCRDESKEERLNSKLQKDFLEITDHALSEKIKLLVKHALIGDGNAIYQIGLKYYYGKNLTENKHIGFRWIKKAAAVGLQEAMFKVAKIYTEGDTVEQNYHKTAIWTKKNARKKSSKALCDLGVLYNEGIGVRNDPLEASKWFTLSADQGNSEAQYQLGCLRQEGRGLRKDEEEAKEWFYLSAKQGNINGCYRFGLLRFSKNSFEYEFDYGFAYGYDYEDDYRYTGNKTSFKLLEYSSEHGCGNAQYEMWKLYRNSNSARANFYFDMLLFSNDISLLNKILKYMKGYHGANIDHTRYFNLLKKAANLGISDAKEMFRTPIRFAHERYPVNEEYKYYAIDMLTLISVNGILSMEYQIGYICENNYNEDISTRRSIDPGDTLYWYCISAEKGDSRAQVRLGIICEEGIKVDINFREAIRYYTLACKKENKDAMYRLACMYLDGRGISQDLERAFELLTLASDAGHIEARKVLMLPCHTLDEYSSEYIYYQRMAVKVKNNNRVRMLELMAESGLVAIQYQLGNFYENEDASKAIKWFILASEGEITDAFYKLAILYESGRGTEHNYLKAISYYQNAILNEHEDSMYRLAQMYLHGNGVEVNYMKSYQLYSTAANLGHALSCKMLGYYLTPSTDPFIMSHTSQKNTESFDLSSSEFRHSILMFQHVAKEGDVEAQYKLGIIHESILDQKNYEEAAKWYSMAVNSSHTEAIYRLGLLFESGLGVTQDYQKAIHLYNKSFRLGNYDALYSLGTLYRRNLVTDIDPKRAIQCYIDASNNGHLRSQHTLGKVYEEGLLTKKDILEALRWYTRAYLKGYDRARVDLYAMYDDLPYEDYFFSKLNTIMLSVLGRLSVLKSEEYNEIQESIFFKLGVQYLYGNGVTQNDAQALKYFTAIDVNYRNDDVGDIKFIKYSHDKELFHKLLNLYGNHFHDLDSFEQYNLAMVYFKGVHHTPEYMTRENQGDRNDQQYTLLAIDYTKAIRYFELFTKKSYHYREVQLQLVKIYTQGIGVQKNIEKVIEYYTRVYTKFADFAFEIANMYHFDKDFCDYSKAIVWYKLAANIWYGKGQRAACNILGLFYKSGDGVNQDYKEARQYFEAPPRDYDKYAAYNLGLMHHHGQGIEMDHVKSYRWFKEAAEKDHKKAQIYLSDMYLNGKGIGKDIQMAKYWYWKASNNNSDNGDIGVADIEEFTFPAEAIKWCKKMERYDPAIFLNSISYSDSMDDGVSANYSKLGVDIMYFVKMKEGDAQYHLGKMYYSGNGVERNYTQAYDYFMKAIETNNSDAYYMLAEMYHYGDGVDQNIEKSIECYKKVDGEKKFKADYQIDILSLLGNEVYENISLSIELFTEAADNGSDFATIALGEHYHSSNTIQDFLKAFKLYQRVTVDGNRNYALRGIGLLFEYGDGVNQDYKKAAQYYQQSADLGNKGGYYNLALIYYHGKGVYRDYKKCFDLLNKSVETEPSNSSTHVFIRTEHRSYIKDSKEKRLYSIESETLLYGEIYFHIGIMHKNGQGTEQNIGKAKKCFLKALKCGNKLAKNEIE